MNTRDEHTEVTIQTMRRWLRKRRSRKTWRMTKLAHRITRESINVFKNLKNVSLDVKRSLIHRIIHYEAQLALLTAKRNVYLDRFSTVLMVILIAVSIITPYAIIKWHIQWFGWVTFLGIWLLSLLIFFIIIILILLPVILRPDYVKSSSPLIIFWLLFSIVTCTYVFYYFNASFETITIPATGIAVLAGIADLFLILSFTFIMALISYISVDLLSKLNKDISIAKFVDHLLQALAIVEDTGRSWDDLSTKNRLMEEIEKAARIIDKEIPKALQPHDPYTDLWQRNRFGEIAAALRDKKHWVCIPKSDTRYHLEKSLTKCFIDAAFGCWDSLEISDRRTTKREGMLRVRIFILGLLVALLPAGVLRVAQIFGFVTSGPLSNYLNFGVVLWAVIALLFAIDPRLGEKIEAVGKLMSIIPGLSKKKEI